jgi:hypothetical protein
LNFLLSTIFGLLPQPLIRFLNIYRDRSFSVALLSAGCDRLRLKRRRYDAGHSCVCDQLSPVLVRMNDHAEKDAEDGRIWFRFFTFRCMSSGVAAASAVLTAPSDRFSHGITSAFVVTVFSMFSRKSAGVSRPITFSKPKFAVTMCMYISLVERASDPGRHENFSAGVASASAINCWETYNNSLLGDIDSFYTRQGLTRDVHPGCAHLRGSSARDLMRRQSFRFGG